MRVLIIEDNEPSRRLLSDVLGFHGYSILQTDRGEEGLRILEDRRPDLVLMDIQLPGIDGFEVAARIDAAGDAPAIVLVSSRDAEDFGSLIAESGARGFIAKHALSGPALAALVA